MNCPNCNAKMSCSCQKRVASDGKAVCTACKPSYEIKIKKGSVKTSFFEPLTAPQYAEVTNVSVFLARP